MDCTHDKFRCLRCGNAGCDHPDCGQRGFDHGICRHCGHIEKVAQ